MANRGDCLGARVNGAIFSDGERVFIYGYDRAPNTWSFTDMTGLVEP